jgi:hypothetical protein
LAKIVDAALAAGLEVTYQPEDSAYSALPEDVKAKLKGYTKELTAEEKLVAKTQELVDANKALEKYRKVAPGVELLADPEPLILQSKVVTLLESLAPPRIVERSSLSMQRQAQAVRQPF